MPPSKKIKAGKTGNITERFVIPTLIRMGGYYFHFHLLMVEYATVKKKERIKQPI